MPGLFSDSKEYAKYAEDLSRQRQRSAEAMPFAEKSIQDRSRGNIDGKKSVRRTRDQPGMTGRARFGQQISAILQDRISDGNASTPELSRARRPSPPTAESLHAEDTVASSVHSIQSSESLDARYTESPFSSRVSEDPATSFLACVLQRKPEDPWHNEDQRAQLQQQMLGKGAHGKVAGGSKEADSEAAHPKFAGPGITYSRRKKDQHQHSPQEGKSSPKLSDLT